MQMLRTTVYLPEELISLAKMRSLEEKVTVTKLVKEGLEQRLGISGRKAKLKKFVWGGFDLGLKSRKWKREWAYE